ncbi:MAG: GGDEF domain-containing protein [Pseudomonadota bacterium]
MQALVLTFIIPAIALIFAAVFAGLWWTDRARHHVAAYAYCYAALGAGVMINIFIFQDVRPLGIVTYHLLCMSGLIALLWGTTHRLGLKIPIRAYTATVLFTAGILSIAAAAGERDAMMMAQNANSSLLMALTAQNLWHSGSRRFEDRALVWVLAFFSSFGFIRPLLTVFSDSLFGPGQEGAMLLLSIHVLVLAIFLTLQALALIATVIVDKSENERETAALDPLSGLPMRAMFEREALALQDRARDAGVPVSLVIADLDHFKRINDTLGHAAGDRVIAAFGALVAGEIRPKDICGRIGGEEFCIIAYKCEGENARSLANRIRMAARRLSVSAGNDDKALTASFGVAEWNAHEPYSAVFERADAALYVAKRSGRDCVVLAGQPAAAQAGSETATALAQMPTQASGEGKEERGGDIKFVELAKRAAGGTR